MVKNKDKKWKRVFNTIVRNRWEWLCISLIVGLVLLIRVLGFSETYDRPLSWSHPDAESTYYMIYVDTTLRDSIMFHSNSVDSFVTLDTDTTYLIQQIAFYIGDTAHYASNTAEIPARGVDIADGIGLNLNYIHIIDTSNDSAAFLVVNYGMSHAMSKIAYGSGSADYRYSASGSATREQSGGSNPTRWIRNASTGEGERIEAVNNDAVEWYNSGTNVPGHAWYVHSKDISSTIKWVNTGDGITLDIRGDGSGDVVQLVAGGSDTSVHNYAIEVEGATKLHNRDNRNENVLQINGTNNSRGLYIWTDSNYAALFSIGVSGDTAFKIAGAFEVTDTFFAVQDPQVTATTDTSAILALGQNHPDVFYGPSATGTGTKNWQLVAYDTSNSTPVPGAKFTITPLGGGTSIVNTAGLGGVLNALVDFDSFYVYTTYPGLAWDPDTFNVSVDGQVDTMKGYSISSTIPIPSQSNMTTVFLTYYRNGTAQPGAYLYVYNYNVSQDTISEAIIGPISEWDRTDNNGIASVEVPSSYVYSDTTKSLYDISIKYLGKIIYEWEDVYIPNTDTFRLSISH